MEVTFSVVRGIIKRVGYETKKRVVDKKPYCF